MDSLNRMAIELVDEILEYAETLNVGASELDNGATVIDCGLDFDGGLEAGLVVTEVQTAGLATPSLSLERVGPATLPHVTLSTDKAGLALLCSQKASWELATADFEGLGSGPARALVAAEAEFEHVGYMDAFDLTALAVETAERPTEAVADQVAEMADVDPGAVFLLAFPSASLVGSVTNAARAAELATVRLVELGYDPQDIVSASGHAPVAPVPADERTAVARSTDALAHGASASLVVTEDLEVVDEVPATPADTSFVCRLEDGDWSFEDIEPGAVGPATVTVDVVGGPTHVAGGVREELLCESFGLDQSAG